MKPNFHDRVLALAEKIEAHGDGTVTLPKPVWKGWTLEREMADFNAKHPAPVTPEQQA